MPAPIANNDKVVVVTGVSSGIGYGITKYLIKQGCHVFGSVRKDEDAKRLQAECGESFSALKFDVTDEEAVQKAAAKLAVWMDGHCLLGLVNNAGIHVGLDALADQPVEKLRKQLEVNLVAQLIVTKAFLPQLGLDLTLKGKPGKILNMSSIYGSYTLPFSSAYSASKAGLNALSEGMRRELKPFGIGVVVIAPGPIRTEIWDDLIGNAEPVADSGSLFARHVQAAHALSVTETSKRSWFWEPEVVGKRVWKVLNRRFPPTHVVVTPNFWLNWFGPTFFPGRIVDIEISRRFKLRREARRSRSGCCSRARSAQMGDADEMARRSRSSCSGARSVQMGIAHEVDVTCSVDHPNPTKESWDPSRRPGYEDSSVPHAGTPGGIACAAACHSGARKAPAAVEEPRALVRECEAGQPLAQKPGLQMLLRSRWAPGPEFRAAWVAGVALSIASALAYLHAHCLCHDGCCRLW